MDTDSIVLSVIGIVIVGVFALFIFRKAKRDETALSWPTTEATIQSAAEEEVGAGRSRVTLPCFAFSYNIGGEYYSGRFALWATGEKRAVLLREMVDRKMTIHYDSDHPSSFFIPEESIEGCEVKLVPD